MKLDDVMTVMARRQSHNVHY